MSKAAEYYYAAIQMAANNDIIKEQNRVAAEDKQKIQDAADATQKVLDAKKQALLDAAETYRPALLDQLVKDIKSGKSTAPDASQQFEDFLAQSNLTATPIEKIKFADTGTESNTARNKIIANTVFRDLLGREPESTVVADYFSGLLNTGFTKTQLEEEIKSSPEYKSKLRSPTELGYEARLGPGDKGVYSYASPYTGKTTSGSVTTIDDIRAQDASNDAFNKASGLRTLEGEIAKEQTKLQIEGQSRLGKERTESDSRLGRERTESESRLGRERSQAGLLQGLVESFDF